MKPKTRKYSYCTAVGIRRKDITVDLIITTRNFGPCVVNLYEVQETLCVVVIVEWSKILKIRVSLKDIIEPIELAK